MFPDGSRAIFTAWLTPLLMPLLYLATQACWICAGAETVINTVIRENRMSRSPGRCFWRDAKNGGRSVSAPLRRDNPSRQSFDATWAGRAPQAVDWSEVFIMSLARAAH